MVTSYAAHIVTEEAEDLGTPEVVVMTQADETGVGEPLAAYPLPQGQSAVELLVENGWYLLGEEQQVQPGYSIVDVAQGDAVKIVEYVTFAREQAEIEHARQERAWKTVIQDAVTDRAAPVKDLAAVANVTPARIYQIRDGRR